MRHSDWTSDDKVHSVKRRELLNVKKSDFTNFFYEDDLANLDWKHSTKDFQKHSWLLKSLENHWNASIQQNRGQKIENPMIRVQRHMPNCKPFKLTKKDRIGLSATPIWKGSNRNRWLKTNLLYRTNHTDEARIESIY